MNVREELVAYFIQNFPDAGECIFQLICDPKFTELEKICKTEDEILSELKFFISNLKEEDVREIFYADLKNQFPDIKSGRAGVRIAMEKRHGHS